MAPSPLAPHHDRLLWVGVACLVLLVAGAVWLMPRLITSDVLPPAETSSPQKNDRPSVGP
jgi:hypothetical protein